MIWCTALTLGWTGGVAEYGGAWEGVLVILKTKVITYIEVVQGGVSIRAIHNLL